MCRSTVASKPASSALKAVRFASLQRLYAPIGIVNDGIAETVAYRGIKVTVQTDGHPRRG
jgi:hypothetical protein